MRARIVVEVPDEFLERRVAEVRADHPGEEGLVGTAEEWFRGRLADVCDDELPIALFGWPAEFTVEPC